MKTLELNGYRFYYKYFESPSPQYNPVFIFNGFMQNMNTWMKYVHFFINKADVILADLPGAGIADSIKHGEFNTDYFAEFTNLIIDDAQINKPDIISASYGSFMAYAFSKKYPERVGHLLIAGAMSRLSEPVRNEIHKSVELLKMNKRVEFANKVVEILLNKKQKHRIPKQSVVERLVKKQFQNLSNSDSEKYILNSQHLLNHPDINVALSPGIKKLVITGEYDVLTDIDAVRNIAKKLTNCAFTTIKNADHLFHLEQLDVTLNLIKEFFRDRPLEAVSGINPVEYY